MLKEALSLKLQQGIKDYIMDFKDILKQFDKVTEKEDNKLLGEKKKTRPSNMLTESAEVVEPVSNELKLPSLKNVFEELSIEPAKPGAQEIHKDGQTIGTVSNPTVANQLKTAMDAGELTIGEQEIQEAEDWIDKAVKKPGAFKAQAERAGMSTSAFAKHVLANKDKFNAKTEKRANLAKTFSKMKETDTPPESSMDLTSPISGGNMRESDGSGSYGGQSPLSYDTQRSSKMKVKEEIKLQQITPKMGDNGSNTQSVISGKKVKEGAQYPADDGSPNSTNDEKGNAAANAALAANDSDTPQLVKEKAKGKVSKSSKLPSISKVKSMCSEGLSTSQIKQLHPKCNQQELNIMIKNTKTNLKEGAEHILKAAKHMGKSHGLCKGSYACPHDAGSEGARAYHEGYKTGLDEACGMKNAYEDANDGFSADAEGMGIRQAPITGMVQEEPEAEVVDTMASYGAMGEAESSPDGNVGADDDGVYDKYDWDAQTVARKGIDEDEFEEGNAFSGALAKAHTGDKFEVGGKEFTKTTEDAYLEEDEWTFESLEKGLQSHLNEGKKSNKRKLDEGYTMSITQGEQNQPDRVSVNATDAEADKLIKFVKDVGLGNYGDAEVLDAPGEVADVSFYGQPDQSEEPMSSHDDMLKLMGIVDMGNGDFEDEVEAPGSCGSDDEIAVQVDDMDEACGDKAYEAVSDSGFDQDAEHLDHDTASHSGDDKRDQRSVSRHGKDERRSVSDIMKDVDEGQGYNDREDEQLGMKDGKESGKKQSYADRRDDSRGDFGHRHGGHLEEKQGYDDEEDESLGMRTGKESGKHQSMKDRRDDSYGKFGKRDSEHREVSKEDIEDRGNISHKDFDQDDEKHDNYGMDDESHGRQHGSLGGRGDKGRGDDSEKPMKFDEDQGYDDKEDESLGMRTGKESDHKQSDKARRDDSYGKFGKRDSEHREKSLEEMMNMIDEMSQGYDDKEDESLGMRTGKESGKHQSMKDRRNDSYGKFGKRDEEHRDIKEQEKDAGTYDKYDWDASTVAKKGIDEESDAERDDHAERAGKEVAHDAHYDGRRHSGRDGEDVTKDLEYDDYKDRHHMEEDQGYDDKEDESLGMRTGKESDKKQCMKDRRDDSYGKFGKRDKEDRHTSLEENLRTLDLLAEVGAESSEEPTQPLSQHDDERLLTKEGAEDAPKDSVNDGENEEITETQTDDQREFTVAEDDDLEEGKIPAGLKAYQDKKKGKKGDSEKDVDEACGDMKEEKLDEWANDAGKNGTDTSFEQDIDFMTKVISGGLNKQKSTGQTTIPVIAGQNDRMGYNGADLVKEGSVMTHDGLAGLMTKLDSLK